MHSFPRTFISSSLLTCAGLSALLTSSTALAQATLPTPSTLVSVCSGASLPRSVVTGIIDPVVTAIYGSVEANINALLGVLAPVSGVVGLPSPLSVDVNGLLTSAAAGSDIGLAVLAADGTIVGPSDQCDAAADSFTLDNPAGIAIGGNQITGLGDPGAQAVAGEIDSVAVGNRASTDASAVGSIALGPDATVGAGAIGGVAIGDGATVNAANSVALGAGSLADRADTVSVGTAGAERQITNVAAGTAPTDAVNLAQLNAATQNAVQYDDATHTVVTLDGAGGTLLTNVRSGAVSATSTDAVNGSQLFGVQDQVNNLQTQVGANTTAITNLSIQIGNGSLGPVQ